MSQTTVALSYNGLMSREEEPDSEESEIKKGTIFDTFLELKLFLQDYAVRHHRPYNVGHSDKQKRLTVLCQRGCG